jgi:catechol 2,3-dioxygenase-like lactoylglutathione lyase family enzyme
MQLGAFSVSLAVKDIAASKAFYEALGFVAIGGDVSQNWLILGNGDATIGLFQGMFEKNILTFNPGWNAKCEAQSNFDDVRTIQADLKARGIKLTLETDPQAQGPAHITLTDPDGNHIMLDQHVPKA